MKQRASPSSSRPGYRPSAGPRPEEGWGKDHPAELNLRNRRCLHAQLKRWTEFSLLISLVSLSAEVTTCTRAVVKSNSPPMLMLIGKCFWKFPNWMAGEADMGNLGCLAQRLTVLSTCSSRSGLGGHSAVVRSLDQQPVAESQSSNQRCSICWFGRDAALPGRFADSPSLSGAGKR